MKGVCIFYKGVLTTGSVGNTIRSKAPSQVASCPFPSIESQNGKGTLSLLPTAMLEVNQRLASGSVWGLNQAPSEGSVHTCPEGRMGSGSEASCRNPSLEKMQKRPRGQVLGGNRLQKRGIQEPDSKGQCHCGQYSEQPRKRVVTGASLVPSMLPDVSLPKGPKALGQVLTRIMNKKTNKKNVFIIQVDWAKAGNFPIHTLGLETHKC